MTDFKTWLQTDTSRQIGDDITFIDADTIKAKGYDQSIRLEGVNAPEVGKISETGEVYGHQEAGGFMSTEQVAKLAKELGFTQVVVTGEAAYGRLAGDLINPETGESFRNRLAGEGILDVAHQYDKGVLAEVADYGELMRTKHGREVSDWDKARAMIEQAIEDEGGAQGHFRVAQTAAGDWAITRDHFIRQGMSEADATAKANSIYNNNVAALEYGGRDTATGESLNPLSDAWDTGMIGVQESMWGIVDLFGEQIDSEWLAQHGKSGVQRARDRIGDRGHYITDYKDIDGFWDAVQYVGNNAVLSLPYMGISAAAAVAAPFTGGASLLAPAAVYTGQTWNEMEGDKNAAVAIGAGVVQAAFDRLGIDIVLKGFGKAPKDMLRAGVAKLVKDGMTKEAAEATIMAATRKELASLAGDAAKVAAGQLQAKAIFKNLSGRVLAGAGGEGATEALQETTAYLGATLGSDKQFDWSELNERQLQALIAGGTLGGAFSVPTTAYDVGAWADVAVRQAPADAERLSRAGRYAEEEKAQFGRVASIQEHTHNTRERAKKAGPNAFPSLEERVENHRRRKKERTSVDTLVDALHSTPSLWQGATRWIFQPEITDRSRSARILADMFGGQLQRTFSGSSYENQKNHIVAIYRNLVPQPKEFWQSRGIKAGPTGLVNRKRAAEESVKIYNALNAAIDPKTKELDMNQVPDDLKPFAQQLLALGDKMWQDQKKYNPELGYQKNYLLRYKSFDKNAINKDKAGFASKLQQHFGFTRAEAMDLADQITDSAEVNDFADILEGTGAAGKPGSHKERTLNLSEHADFQNFMEQSIFSNIANAAKSAARYQAYQEFVGENHSVINQLLSDMEADGVAPEVVDKVAAQMQDYLAAESGNYKRAESEMGKKLERIQRNLMTWMTIAGLPLATISSIVEAALTTKGLTKGDVGTLKSEGEKIGKAMWDKFGEATEFDDKMEGDTTPAIQTQNVLEKLGYTNWDVGSATTTSTATRVGATEVSDIKSALLENYFIATGLTGWTNLTRTIRAGFAGDFLAARLDLIANSDPETKTNEVQEAEEQLRNYGLNVDEAVQAYLHGQPIDAAQLREFQWNWINDAVVLPQAANRPLIYQDPRFALFTQFQGFISAFTANQIPKMWGEYVKRGTPAMKYNAFATMATMIMLGFASQYLKDLIKHGQPIAPGEHPWLEDSEYIQRGIRASGLLGTSERLLDQFFPIYETRSKNAGEWLFNTTTGESPALGFAKRAIGGVGALAQGDVGKAAKEGVRLTPFGPLNFLRDAVGNAASSWNFKGE